MPESRRGNMSSQSLSLALASQCLGGHSQLSAAHLRSRAREVGSLGRDRAARPQETL